MLSSVPTIDCRLLITCVIRRGDQCVGYLMVTLPTPQRASLQMGARETPSQRGDYGCLMCSRTSQLASVRYQTELPSCGRNDRNQRRKTSESSNTLVGRDPRAFHLNNIRSVSGGGRRFSLAEKARGDGPAMPVIGDDRYRFLVVSDHHPANGLVPVRLKANPFADLEPQHLDMSPHLPDHAEPLDNLLVEVDEFRLGEMIDINFHC